MQAAVIISMHKQFQPILERCLTELLLGAASNQKRTYGLELTYSSPDSDVVDLVFTFKSGQQYCCFESGCHLGLFRDAFWKILRSELANHGMTALPKLTIRKIRCVVEQGAISESSGDGRASDGYSYEVGPFVER